jgi:hypothetical protein
MGKNSAPRNQSPVNADNFEVQVAVSCPPLDEATAGEVSPPSSEAAADAAPAAASPSGPALSQPGVGARAAEANEELHPTGTGSELEAEDRALLRAEDARLRRLAEAFDREAMRRVIGRFRPVSADYPWLTRSLNCERPMYIYNYLKLERQVDEEFAALKRKQLERQQRSEKEDLLRVTCEC